MTKQNKKRFTNVAVYEETHEKLAKISAKVKDSVAKVIDEFATKKLEELEKK